MEGASARPPDAPEEPPKVASFDYPMAELGAMVSGALGAVDHIGRISRPGAD